MSTISTADLITKHYGHNLDRVLPRRNRKLYPFYWHTNFAVMNDKKAKLKKNPPLLCSYCGTDCADGGNGSYFCAYIVFESPTEIKAACHPSCFPKKRTYEFHDQLPGYRYPILFPEQFKPELKNRVVFHVFMRSHSYELVDKIKSGVTQDYILKEHNDFSGGCNSEFCEQWEPGKKRLLYGQRRISYKLNMKEIVEIVNSILSAQEPFIRDQFKWFANAPYVPARGSESVTTKKKATRKDADTVIHNPERKELLQLAVETGILKSDPVKAISAAIDKSVDASGKANQDRTDKSANTDPSIVPSAGIEQNSDAGHGQPAKSGYTGAKNGDGVYQAIINQFAPHTRYIEGCLGSGAILRKKKPATENIGIEINGSVIDSFTYPAGVKIVNQCIISWLQSNASVLDRQTLLYLDPPYPKQSRRSDVDLYEYEMTDAQHRELLTIIKTLPCMVAISTYENSIYKELLADWRYITYNSKNRGYTAVEWLYMNYPVPTELHEYTYLGRDYIDRQRIKRKITSAINKLKALPDLERNAILSRISDIA